MISNTIVQKLPKQTDSNGYEKSTYYTAFGLSDHPMQLR